MRLSELQSTLLGKTLDDVLLRGFVEQEGVSAKFHAVRTSVFFEFGGVFLQFEVIEDGGEMRLVFPDEIPASPELDADMLPAVTSIGEQILLDDVNPSQVVCLRLWHVVEAAEELRCWAAQVELANGQEVFVDPSHHFGIKIGGRGQREAWRENWPGAQQEQEQILRLAKP